MCQCGQFDEVKVDRMSAERLLGRVQLHRYPFGHLSDFQRVGQPVPEEVGLMAWEELSLALEAPERRAVQQPTEVPAECGASSITVFGLAGLHSIGVGFAVQHVPPPEKNKATVRWP